METSVFLAKLFGVIYLAAGLGMLVDAKHYQKVMKDVAKSPAIIYLSGFITLAIGLTMVMYHNIWVKDWTVVITVIAWLALVKGVLLLVLPDAMMDWTKEMTKKKGFLMFGGLIALILGLYLGYYGYFA